MIHFFKQSISHIALPEKFTYPFHYTPHPLCIMAAEEVKQQIAMQKEWQEELTAGKMFGVLVVEVDTNGAIGFLAAFSGNLDGKNLHPYFVPPVYDLLQPQGFFKKEEEQISAISIRISKLENAAHFLAIKERLKTETQQTEAILQQAKAKLKAAKEVREIRRRSLPPISEKEQTDMIRESQFQKAEYKRLEKAQRQRIEEIKSEINRFELEIEQLKKERKERSATLQQRLFEQFRMLNAKGETKDLCTIFEQTVQKMPPGGAGECALPKLLQYAYLHQLNPLAMAEFWWGGSPKDEIRRHGYYYPSCKGKCEPILQHMLQGLEVEDNPLLADVHKGVELETVFEDEWLLAVNKPAGMLSVPGKAEDLDSVYQRMRTAYPNATGPMIVHRLDMATSGLLLIAKTKEVHQLLQAQFENRSIRKRYVALLDGIIEQTGDTGRIVLSICPDLSNRPRQIVNEEYGKEAITEYQILNQANGHTRVALYPVTGRTHQLRIHAAHPKGLNCPILGDELYGKKADRLYLHAEEIEFRHPVSGQVIRIQKKAGF